MSLNYNLVGQNGQQVLTVWHDGEPYLASDTHPSWDAILTGTLAGDESVLELFDIEKAVRTRFESVADSDQVTVRDGKVYFDGVEVHTGEEKAIIRLIEEGHEDYTAVVRFLEKVRQNPEKDSQEQAYKWLVARDFTLLPNGNVLGYKGVCTGADGVPRSGWKGHAIVDGVEYGAEEHDYIPYVEGSVVEMPRDEVQHDPSVTCAPGLHVSGYDYARDYGDTMTAVEVNPRDMVSVPNESSASKMRVCRLIVRGPVESENTNLIADVDVEDDDIDDDFGCACGCEDEPYWDDLDDGDDLDEFYEDQWMNERHPGSVGVTNNDTPDEGVGWQGSTIGTNVTVTDDTPDDHSLPVYQDVIDTTKAVQLGDPRPTRFNYVSQPRQAGGKFGPKKGN